MSDYAVTHLDEIDELSDGRCPWRPVRFHLGITSFGVNAFTGREAGDRLINEHDESQENDQQEELYLVQQGRARFELAGEQVDAPAGTLVYVQPSVKRTAFAEEAGTTLIALGGRPGHAYEPGGYELWVPLRRLFQEGKYDEVADQGRESIEAHPEYPVPLYNLACAESLAGRTEDAVKHLRMALAHSELPREMAKTDSDFDPIREDAAFKELIG
jgi:mannose-6-phosphate isomerase-like protein (cupin superfamily)